jgi:hypothetical protein
MDIKSGFFSTGSGIIKHEDTTILPTTPPVERTISRVYYKKSSKEESFQTILAYGSMSEYLKSIPDGKNVIVSGMVTHHPVSWGNKLYLSAAAIEIKTKDNIKVID